MPPKVLTNEQIQQMKGGGQNGGTTAPAKVLTPQQMQGLVSQRTKPQKVPTSLGQKFLNAGTAVTNLLGGKSVADTFGSEIARLKAKTPQERAYIESTAPTVAQTAGSALQLGAGFAPIGRVAQAVSKGARALGAGLKTSKVLGNVGSLGGAGYAFDVGANLQEEKNPLTPGLGTAIGAGLPLIPPALKGAAKLGLESVGVTTGVGGGVTKRIFDAARQGGNRADEAAQAFRGKTSPEQIVDDARNALSQVVRNRTTKYQADLANLKAVQNKSFSLQPVISKFDEKLTELGVVKTPNGYDFLRAPGMGRYEKDIMQLQQVLKKWGSQKGDRTVAGIDKLKQVIDDFRIGSSDSRKFDSFITALRNEAKNLGKDIPEYQKMLKGYEESTGLIKEIQKGLSLGDKASTDTAFRKLTTALRTNNEFRQQLIKELDAVSGKDLSTQIAGQQMSELLPRGIMRQLGTAGAVGGAATGFFIPLLKAAFLFSPRVVAEILTAAGYTARKADQVMKFIAPQGIKAPGDMFLETPTGRKTEDYLRNIQPGLSMKNVALGKTPTNLNLPTLKSLTMLENEVKTPTVSKQYLLDLANRGELKQAERDLLRKFIDEEGDAVDVKSFAAKVKSELLPLKRSGTGEDSVTWKDFNRYENVNLPDEQRGPVANYSEHIYESPISTSAGSVHFADTGSKNYFAHSRIEDLPDQTSMSRADRAARTKAMMNGDYSQGGVPALGKNQGGTRRVIEIQSDLFQKGRLEGELPNRTTPEQLEETRRVINAKPEDGGVLWSKAEKERVIRDQEALMAKQEARAEELKKLEPYRNTWHERVIREEVKQAAKDGKTKLQFPTGETAMKIEGLGDNTSWTLDGSGPMDIGELEVGREIMRATDEIVDEADSWIITDVLGDGKFKAVQKIYNDNVSGYHIIEDKLSSGATQYIVKKPEGGSIGFPSKQRAQEYIDNEKHILERSAETFDISGKVDTNNPIYRFYEKDIQKYLTKKYGAKVITDPQGVKWIELNVPKDAGKLPVEAFGALPAIPALLGEKGDPKDRE